MAKNQSKIVYSPKQKVIRAILWILLAFFAFLVIFPVLYIVLGLGALIGGGELFVEGACGIARSAGVSEAVIGLTLVAGGTSLPELATSVVAARKGQSALAIGNVVGSNIFNIFFILGTCATLKPLAVTGLTLFDFAMLTASALLFWQFSRSSYKLSRWEGWTMMLTYALYLGWLVANT